MADQAERLSQVRDTQSELAGLVLNQLQHGDGLHRQKLGQLSHASRRLLLARGFSSRAYPPSMRRSWISSATGSAPERQAAAAICQGLATALARRTTQPAAARNSALTAAPTRPAPPRLPSKRIWGRPPTAKRCLLSATPTKPTGIPITRLGAAPHNSPTPATAPGPSAHRRSTPPVPAPLG